MDRLGWGCVVFFFLFVSVSGERKIWVGVLFREFFFWFISCYIFFLFNTFRSSLFFYLLIHSF